jgi:membrane peptidoglycan carboxypeptidase
MHGVLVGGRVHGDRGYAELLAGAQNAQGDFTAVCDQDFVEHCGILQRRIWRSAVASNASALIR